MTEFADGPVTEVSKIAFSHTERELGYLVHFKRNTKDLKSNADRLEARKNVVMRLIAAARRNDELIREEVETWLTSVENVLNDATKLDAEAALTNSWFKGWFSCSRFILRRRAEKKVITVQRLLEDAQAFGDIVSDPRPAQGLVLPGEFTSTRDIEGFPSRVAITKRVICALQDDNVNLLGVYGMPGVGKTTLISALALHAKEKKVFDEVVMVKLSQIPDMKLIQRDVASFVRQDITMIWPSLDELSVLNCPGLQRLPLGAGSIPKLEKLIVDLGWFEELTWEDQSVNTGLHLLLNTLHLQWCHSLKHVVLVESDNQNASLIPCDSRVKLQNLDKLVVLNCSNIEKLVEFKVESKTRENKVSLYSSAGSSSSSS